MLPIHYHIVFEPVPLKSGRVQHGEDPQSEMEDMP